MSAESPPPTLTADTKSPVADLWAQWYDRVKSIVARYWLLASQPSDYFDKFIKDQSARELKRTIAHSFLVASIYTLFFSTVFDNIAALGDFVPAPLRFVLTKPFVLYAVFLLGSLPSLLVSLLIYRIYRISRSDYLIFICFNVITLYLVLVFMSQVVFYVLGAPVTLILSFGMQSGHDKLFSWLIYASSFFVLGAPLYIIFSLFYYVPMILIQRSTGKSTIFASSLCIIFGLLSIFTLGTPYYGTFIQSARQISPPPEEQIGPPPPDMSSPVGPVPSTSTRHSRLDNVFGDGIYALYAGSLLDAEKDLSKALELDGSDAYAALWIDVVRARRNLPSQSPAPTIDLSIWPGPIIRMFQGDETPAAVLAATDDPDQGEKLLRACEATFFSGEWALRQGPDGAAERLFRLAVDKCGDDTFERYAARKELELLGRKR